MTTAQFLKFFVLICLAIVVSVVVVSEGQASPSEFETPSNFGAETDQTIRPLETPQEMQSLAQEYCFSFSLKGDFSQKPSLIKNAFEDGSDALLINGNPPTYISLPDMKDRNLDISGDGKTITVSNKDGKNPLKFEGATRISAADINTIPEPLQEGSGKIATPLSETSSFPPLLIEVAESIDLGETGTIVGAREVYVYPDSFFAKHIDTFIKGTTIASNIDNLHAQPQIFSVGSADSVITNGMTFSGVENSTFAIEEGSARVDAHSEGEFTITDSSYVSSTFKGNGTLIIETSSHVQNETVSFAIDEIAQWIEETLAEISQNAVVTINGTSMIAKNAAKAGTPLFYDAATHAISTDYAEEGILLSYEPILDAIVPSPIAELIASLQPITTLPSALPLQIAQQLVDEVVDMVKQSAAEPVVYTISDGTLTFEGESGIAGMNAAYNETIDATNSTAVIAIDPAFGVACMQLLPKSGYNYIDPVIERDFSLYIPANGAPYTLCLKKGVGQQFQGQEGMVNFLSKEMSLRNIINYKRYPLKNNKIVGTLTTEVYQGKSKSRAELKYLPDFILLDSIRLQGVPLQSRPNIAQTDPSNYYSISEETVLGNKKRLVFADWKLTGVQYTQSIPQSYSADTYLPPLTLVHNVLIQDNGNARITILPPEHETITTLVE